VYAAAAALLLTLAAPRPAAAQLSIRFGEPMQDPKAEQIKTGLEKRDLAFVGPRLEAAYGRRGETQVHANLMS
jgi:hypothetical protein